MEKEYWRPIVGFEGLYEVSNHGRIKSLNYNKTGKEQIRKLDYGKYVRVWLSGDKQYLVHRLVMEAFVPNPLNLPQVNHKDENRYNNFVYVNEDGTVDLEKSNLEWCDAKYNSTYGKQQEIHRRIGEMSSKKTDILGLSFGSQREAADYFGVSTGLISMYLNGKIQNSRSIRL